MSTIDIENVMKHIDFQKIEEEKKNGKSMEEILNGIDLRPIIKEEMMKTNPNVEDPEIDSVVKGIDLAKMLDNIVHMENLSREMTGKSFDELSEEDMRMLQGAGDVDVEVTPTPTVSSYPCLGVISAVSGGVFSWATC